MVDSSFSSLSSLPFSLFISMADDLEGLDEAALNARVSPVTHFNSNKQNVLFLNIIVKLIHSLVEGS